MDSRGTVFREIHKNTWLKRLTLDNKKITVGSKKSDRTWVVFCVHDDTEAILEGYIEPRQAAFHTPEWTIPLQTTLHISHALVPTESEYEFVITLASDVIRFNASSWEIMQEWVDTLRQKLREMKILSPKENLYSKLPELRAPLLPTRDPTSPLPAPPPVPAALVPGIEQIVPATNAITSNAQQSQQMPSNGFVRPNVSSSMSPPSSPSQSNNQSNVAVTTTTLTPSIPTTAMSNTLTQNLINMLSNPVSTYSSHVTNDNASDSSDTSINDDNFFFSDQSMPSAIQSFPNEKCRKKSDSTGIVSLAKTFSNNVLADPNTCPSTSGLLSHANDREKSPSHLETDTETSSIDSTPSVMFQTEPLIIPRPQTSRSSSRSKRPTPLQPHLSKQITPLTRSSDEATSTTTNITIIQVPSPSASAAKQSQKDIFMFPSVSSSASVGQSVELADDSFKSNVQIIPSNYSPPPFKATTKTNIGNSEQKVTTVQVSGVTTTMVAGYGKIIRQSSQIETPVVISTPSPSTPIDHQNKGKIKSFGAVTNIPIGTAETSSTTATTTPATTAHYEQVFISPSPTLASAASIPPISTATAANTCESQSINHSSIPSPKVLPPNSKSSANKNASQSIEFLHINRINLPNKRGGSGGGGDKENNAPDINSIVPSTSSSAAAAAAAAQTLILRNMNSSNSLNNGSNHSTSNSNSNSNSNNNNNNKKNVIISGGKRENLPSPLPAIRQFLTRGLTEVAIIRPSRKDSVNPINRNAGRNKNLTANKSDSQPDIAQQEQRDQREQRRRSSSTSDAQGVRFRPNGNSINSPSTVAATASAPTPESRRLIQQPLTLREQQVFQLRREMMHPGGVRIQLRRKDCTGSIALVDAFGGVWITGWKQKEHPMLYNALHIGDQLVSIGGVTINTSADANRLIRNTSGLYIELIIRRIPFGRVYAIRREIDGQCIGLIRDGNTATIVDVIPNSLSARHGLPPKAQSCDGLSLTFWVLTEINGRPLNLFFKDNEVRDRLNAVGRDLSILVQPSDLITKLRKQLKSLRGYKDYIVQ